jgi:uncharacterized SAM-binding protein YcdF (DUF218 family)
VHPRTATPREVDAIFVLGPPSANGRFEYAQQLVASGYAKNLVISAGPYEVMPIRRACKNGLGAVRVICFFPTPTTTQGEARKIRELTALHGWHTVMVVTSRYHVSRARFIIGRCYSGQLLMTPPDGTISLRQWGYEFLYQTGAFAKAVMHPSC